MTSAIICCLIIIRPWARPSTFKTRTISPTELILRTIKTVFMRVVLTWSRIIYIMDLTLFSISKCNCTPFISLLFVLAWSNVVNVTLYIVLTTESVWWCLCKALCIEWLCGIIVSRSRYKILACFWKSFWHSKSWSIVQIPGRMILPWSWDTLIKTFSVSMSCIKTSSYRWTIFCWSFIGSRPWVIETSIGLSSFSKGICWSRLFNRMI